MRAIGLDVGVTNIKAVMMTADGDVIARRSFETRSQSPDWPDRVKSHLAEMERESGTADCVGLAAPGVAHADGSAIRWMQGRLGEVQGLRWSDYLGRAVPVLNDAQAALLGEAWLGAARGASHAMMLTLGTGVGGAAIVDGRLLRGWLGRAGHLGHICLDIGGEKDIARTPGSLENMIGNCTIAARSGGRFDSTHALIEACRLQDAGAIEVWRRSVEALACGIASLVNVLDPQIVVIGGGIAAAGEMLMKPLTAALEQCIWKLSDERVAIALAQLGEYAGAIGAARQAFLSAGEGST